MPKIYIASKYILSKSPLVMAVDGGDGGGGREGAKKILSAALAMPAGEK